MSAELTPIPYAQIASSALGSAESLLKQWLPNGKLSSGEYQSVNPVRADSAAGSFNINVNTGKWGDFATDAAGGDLISLYAYLNGIEQWEAAIEVADLIGFGLPDGCRPDSQKNKTRKKPVVDASKVKPKKKPEVVWQPIIPVPVRAPEHPIAHLVRGKPEMQSRYMDADNNLLGFVYRFKTSDGGKDTLPLVFAKNSKTGAEEWRWMQWTAPNRPLYGLDRLASKPDAWVLLVEGEKCADAPVELLLNNVVVSWPGGSKAINKIDWSPLAGRNIYAWADCDAKREPLTKAEKADGVDPNSKPLLSEENQPGMKAMLAIKEKLMALDAGTQFQLVDIPAPNEKADGWDVADAIDEGMGSAALIKFITKTRPDLKVVEKGEKISSPPPESGEGAEAELAEDKPNKKNIDWGRFWRLCDNFVLIYTTDTVFDVESGLIMKVGALRLAFGSEYVKMWLNNDRRRMIHPDQLVFDPTNKSQPPCINLFKGFAMKPKTSVDITPITDLVEHLCDNSATKQEFNDVVEWVIKWLAYPLQNPGAKMDSALVFHGPQGAGKNLLFEDVIAKIYGDYAVVVGQSQLEADFNEWASQKLFVIGDEVVARTELYHQKNKLKAFITGQTILINPKGLPIRKEANHCNVVFLSNEHQPLALEVGDRRYMVVYTPPKRKDDLYRRVGDCIRAGGVESFYHFLMQLDLGDFSPHTHPIMTSAKQELIDLNLRPEELFAHKLVEGELALPMPMVVCSTKQLYEVFVHWTRQSGYRFAPDANAFTSKLNKSLVTLAAARGEKPMMIKKKVRMPKGHQPSTEYIWLPDGCGPRDGVSIGEFAATAISEFQEVIGKLKERHHDD